MAPVECHRPARPRTSPAAWRRGGEARSSTGHEGVSCAATSETLHNFQPPATDEEVRASALQFVRKLSGFTRPSKANQLAFTRAVDQVAQAARRAARLPRHQRSAPRSRRRGFEGPRQGGSAFPLPRREPLPSRPLMKSTFVARRRSSRGDPDNRLAANPRISGLPRPPSASSQCHIGRLSAASWCTDANRRMRRLDPILSG